MGSIPKWTLEKICILIICALVVGAVLEVNQLLFKKDRPSAAKLDGLAGEYGDFSLSIWGNEVRVLIKTTEPRAFMKALSTAIEIVETKGRQKILWINPGNTSPISSTAEFRLCIENPEFKKPKSEKK